MRQQTLGPKPPFQDVTIKARVAISAGAPCCYIFDGTQDAVEVTTPSVIGATNMNVAYAGVCQQNLTAGQFGNATVFGYVGNVDLIQQSRAATTDAFASAASIAAFVGLGMNTVHNRFISSGANPLGVVLAQTLATAAAVASNATDTRLTIGASVKAFCRYL